MDDNTDAWFVGFDPDITVGVWIGFDDKRKSLGAAEQGSFVALPIWMEFMKAYIDGRPDKDDPPEFEAPGNIVFLAVDKTNGTVLPAETTGAIHEAFISGTQPGREQLQPPASRTNSVALEPLRSCRAIAISGSRAAGCVSARNNGAIALRPLRTSRARRTRTSHSRETRNDRQPSVRIARTTGVDRRGHASLTVRRSRGSIARSARISPCRKKPLASSSAGNAASTAVFDREPRGRQAARSRATQIQRSTANSASAIAPRCARRRHSNGTGNTRFACHAPSAAISAYAAGVAHATLTMPHRGAATMQMPRLSAAPAPAIHASTCVRRSMYKPGVTTA